MESLPIADVRHVKVDATVRFEIYGKPETRSNEYPGVFHLWEHNYNPSTKFWHGVGMVDCPYEAVEQVQQKGRIWDFGVFVRLEDGRGGMARLLNLESEDAGDAASTHLALVGVTTLEKE